METKRVIYSAFNDERGMIIDYLKKVYGWDPVMIIGVEKSRLPVVTAYPNAIFLEEMSIRRARFDYSRIGSQVPIDAKIIEALSKFELSCLNLLEDTTGWNFSFYERRRYYYDLLKYWNTVIHNLKPNLYLNITWPHTLPDYALYLLCKYYYSIPTIFISPAPLFEGYFHVACISLEERDAISRDIYQSGEKLALNPEIIRYLSNLKSKEGKAPEYIDKAVKRAREYEGFQYWDLFRQVVFLFNGKSLESANLSFKCNQLPIESSRSHLNRLQHFIFKNRLRCQNQRLRRIYNTFTIKPDLKNKYIYFAAPYQPEAATCPSAGVYEDIFLVLDIISASIPQDWKIYYKEHYATFFGFLRGSLARDVYFYKKVASYSKVIMIPVEIDSFSLIDNSQAVASVTGTSSWEAVVRGKPALFFGDVWYQGCKSLFRIKTYQDCVEAMEKIRNGYKPDQRDIEHYAASIERVAKRDLIHHHFADNIKKCQNPGIEMERIAKLFYESYNRYYVQQE